MKNEQTNVSVLGLPEVSELEQLYSGQWFEYEMTPYIKIGESIQRGHYDIFEVFTGIKKGLTGAALVYPLDIEIIVKGYVNL